jgi:hypothetical protein
MASCERTRGGPETVEIAVENELCANRQMSEKSGTASVADDAN